MTVTVEELPDLLQRLDQLDLVRCGDLVLLPRGYSSASSAAELVHESSASTLAKLLRQSGLVVGLAEPSEFKLPVLQENAITWVAPAIFVALAVASSNPSVVSVGLNVLSDYVTDFFRGTIGAKRVRLDIVLELPSGSCKRVHYDGPIEGLPEIRRTITGLGLHRGE